MASLKGGQLKGLQLASDSGPSSRGQEKRVQRSVGNWGTNTYIVANQSDGPIVRGREEMVQYGSVKVKVGRRIHVSNQRGLASKREKVERGIEVRGSSCQISTRTRTQAHTHVPQSVNGEAWGLCIKQNNSVNPAQGRGDNSQLSSTSRHLLVTVQEADRKETQSRALYIRPLIRLLCI